MDTKEETLDFYADIITDLLIPSQVLPHLAGFLEESQESDILAQESSSSKTAARLMLGHLRHSSQGWCVAFINALEKEGYSLISKLIDGEINITHHQIYKNFLRIFSTRLADDLDAEDVLPYLIQCRCLNDCDEEDIIRITRTRGRRHAALILLMRVGTKNENWFAHFMYALKFEYGHIVDSIEPLFNGTETLEAAEHIGDKFIEENVTHLAKSTKQNPYADSPRCNNKDEALGDVRPAGSYSPDYDTVDYDPPFPHSSKPTPDQWKTHTLCQTSSKDISTEESQSFNLYSRANQHTHHVHDIRNRSYFNSQPASQKQCLGHAAPNIPPGVRNKPLPPPPELSKGHQKPMLYSSTSMPCLKYATVQASEEKNPNSLPWCTECSTKFYRGEYEHTGCDTSPSSKAHSPVTRCKSCNNDNNYGAKKDNIFKFDQNEVITEEMLKTEVPVQANPQKSKRVPTRPPPPEPLSPARKHEIQNRKKNRQPSWEYEDININTTERHTCHICATPYQNVFSTDACPLGHTKYANVSEISYSAQIQKEVRLLPKSPPVPPPRKKKLHRSTRLKLRESDEDDIYAKPSMFHRRPPEDTETTPRLPTLVIDRASTEDSFDEVDGVQNRMTHNQASPGIGLAFSLDVQHSPAEEEIMKYFHI